MEKSEAMAAISANLQLMIGDRNKAAVAGRAGITPKQLGKYVRGEAVPRADTILQLCRGLGCTPNELLGMDRHCIECRMYTGGRSRFCCRNAKAPVHMPPSGYCSEGVWDEA